MAQRFYWKQYVTDKQVTFYIADLILKPGEQIEAHCHDYYEFFVVLKGTFLERCNGQELVMQPGMGQLLGPDDVHTLSNPFGEQNLLYNIAVRKDRYEQLTAPLFGSGNGSKDAPVFDLDSESLEGFRGKIAYRGQLCFDAVFWSCGLQVPVEQGNRLIVLFESGLIGLKLFECL